MQGKMEAKEKVKKSRSHSDFEDIETHIRLGDYLSSISAKDFGSKSNFRRAAKKFRIKDGYLYHGKKFVIKGYVRYKGYLLKMCHLRHRLRSFSFRRKVMFRSQHIQVFVFLTIP